MANAYVCLKGGWGEKRPKTCLRNTWMVPNLTIDFSIVWTSGISRATIHYIILFINSRSKRTLETVTNLHETKNKRSSTIHLLGPRSDSRSKRSLLLNKSKESIENYKTSYEWHKLEQEIRAQSPFVKQLEKNKTKTFSTKFCVWWKKEWWYTTGDQKKRRKPKN